MKIIQDKHDVFYEIWNFCLSFGAEDFSSHVYNTIMASKHPEFGADWSKWLNKNLESFLDALVEESDEPSPEEVPYENYKRGLTRTPNVRSRFGCGI